MADQNRNTGPAEIYRLAGLTKTREKGGVVFELRVPSFSVHRGELVGLVGPSGCGKSTFLRCLNRMNDLIPGTRVEGQLMLDEQDIYDKSVNVADLRRRVGMVFQRPNPFPTMSIYDNVLAGYRLNGMKLGKSESDRIVVFMTAENGKVRAVAVALGEEAHRVGHALGRLHQTLARGVLADLPGPKIRVGALDGGEIPLETGREAIERFFAEETMAAQAGLSVYWAIFGVLLVVD